MKEKMQPFITFQGFNMDQTSLIKYNLPFSPEMWQWFTETTWWDCRVVDKFPTEQYKLSIPAGKKQQVKCRQSYHIFSLFLSLIS